MLQSSRYADGAVLPQPPRLAVGLVRSSSLYCTVCYPGTSNLLYTFGACIFHNDIFLTSVPGYQTGDADDSSLQRRTRLHSSVLMIGSQSNNRFLEIFWNFLFLNNSIACPLMCCKYMFVFISDYFSIIRHWFDLLCLLFCPSEYCFPRMPDSAIVRKTLQSPEEGSDQKSSPPGSLPEGEPGSLYSFAFCPRCKGQIGLAFWPLLFDPWAFALWLSS